MTENPEVTLPESAENPLEARYRKEANPLKNEIDFASVGFGILSSLLTVIVLGFLYWSVPQLISLFSGYFSEFNFQNLGSTLGFLFLTVIIAFCYGGLVVLFYGIPIAVIAALVLAPVKQEWLHLLVFAVLGYIGGLVSFGLILAMNGSDFLFMLTGGVLSLYGIFGAIVAVSGRFFAKKWAVRRYLKTQSTNGEKPQTIQR